MSHQLSLKVNILYQASFSPKSCSDSSCIRTHFKAFQRSLMRPILMKQKSIEKQKCRISAKLDVFKEEQSLVMQGSVCKDKIWQKTFQTEKYFQSPIQVKQKDSKAMKRYSLCAPCQIRVQHGLKYCQLQSIKLKVYPDIKMRVRMQIVWQLTLAHLLKMSPLLDCRLPPHNYTPQSSVGRQK